MENGNCVNKRGKAEEGTRRAAAPNLGAMTPRHCATTHVETPPPPPICGAGGGGGPRQEAQIKDDNANSLAKRATAQRRAWNHGSASTCVLHGG